MITFVFNSSLDCFFVSVTEIALHFEPRPIGSRSPNEIKVAPVYTDRQHLTHNLITAFERVRVG
jgi:hypothetical protein